MDKTCRWLLLLGLLCACTCGGRTECINKGKITLLTNIHDDIACDDLSQRGVMTYEAAKYLVETHNNKTDSFKIDLAIYDTCGSIAGAVKATMKALVWSDLECLRPPFYLGMIGPYAGLNVEAVQKITASLSIPQIVRSSISSPYLHNLDRESDSAIINAILGVIDTLRWKSLGLVTSDYGNNEDDIQHIAKKVTAGAIARGICVMIHDDDDEDFGSHIVHIGQPSDRIMKLKNTTILIASEGNLKSHVNRYNALSNIILVQDARNEFVGLENRVKNSHWWSADEMGQYDYEELRDVRWLQDAISIYTKAMGVLCAKQQCTDTVNAAEWNSVISNVLATHNAKLQTSTRKFDMLFKKPSSSFEKLAEVSVRNDHPEVRWVSKYRTDDSLTSGLISNEERKSDCAALVKDDDDNEVAKVLFSSADDQEWWTMVATVGGVGISMFAVGIFAVYIVMHNIREPRSPKNKVQRRSSGGSLRRIESDQDLQVVTSRPQRPAREPPQRRASDRSIRSVVSDKSV